MRRTLIEMKSVFFVAIFLLAGCASSQKGSAIPPGPNYSATPCSDNCGSDPGCNAGCTPLSSPGTIQPTTVYSSQH